MEGMHGLFACVVTGRSWKAIQRGISKQVITEAEVGSIVLLQLIILLRICQFENEYETAWSKPQFGDDKLGRYDFRIETD